MKLTIPGKDYLIVNDEILKCKDFTDVPKVHIIKFNFKEPTKEKVDATLTLFDKTNRFVISDNIKFYNDILKKTYKKYYVMNNTGDGLVTYFRKNNKVLLNINNLSQTEKDFVLQVDVLRDVLKNIEVIQISEPIYLILKMYFEYWNGNVILSDD